MRVSRLAELFVLKYAASPTDNLEISLRADIHSLWELPNKHFNVLRACAQAEPSNPKTLEEVKAIEGFKFCQQLLSMIDYMKSHMMEISLGEIREVLLNIVNLVQKHLSLKFDEKGKPSEKGKASGIQFAHVSELIFQMIPVSGKHDRTLRDQQYQKAKKGLARILSLATTMLEKIEKLEMAAPEKFTYQNVTKVDIDQNLPERFAPQRAPLSVYDTVDFIRQHGDEYGIPTNQDWATVFRDDPQLKEEMTTIINAINRGHLPRGSADMKMEIARIMKEHEERKSTNMEALEEP